MEETPWERVHTTPEVEPIAEVGEICIAQDMHCLGFRETSLKRATTNGRAMKQWVIQRNLMLGIMHHCKFLCRIWMCKSFPLKTKNLLLTSPSTYFFIYLPSFQIIPSQTSRICHSSPVWRIQPGLCLPRLQCK